MYFVEVWMFKMGDTYENWVFHEIYQAHGVVEMLVFMKALFIDIILKIKLSNRYTKTTNIKCENKGLVINSSIKLDIRTYTMFTFFVEIYRLNQFNSCLGYNILTKISLTLSNHALLHQKNSLLNVYLSSEQI